MFLTEPLDSMKECNVSLSYGANCNALLGVYEVSGIGDILETPPLVFNEDIDEYCYKVVARNQNLNFNVKVEGIINLQRSNSSTGNSVIQNGI